MHGLIRDLRFALRALRRTPAFTTVAVLCLALGIGATSTIFGVVDALFLRPPAGVGDPGALVRPYVTRASGAIHQDNSSAVSYPDFEAWRHDARSVQGVAAFADVGLSLGRGVDARLIDGMLVSGNYFGVLAMTPALGRFFTPEEDAGAGSPPAAVISHAFWEKRFGGARTALGAVLLLDGHAVPIVGVAPAGFAGLDPGNTDVWLPMSQATALGFGPVRFTPYWLWLRTVARLAPGATRAAAATEMATILARTARATADSASRLDARPLVRLGPVQAARGPSPSEQATVARWLAIAAALVLLIACANTANLLLARGEARRKEIAVRLAVGATRGRLTRQLLVESGVLALLGAAGGILLAMWGMALVPVAGLSSLGTFASGRVLLFAVLAAAACAGLFGLVPALRTVRADLAASMKEGVREGTDRRSPLRDGLLVLQVALAVVLLAGAGLFIRSLHNLQTVDTGLDVPHLLRVDVDLHGVGLSDTAAARFYDQAMTRLRTLPGVADATLSAETPLSGNMQIMGYSLPGHPRDILHPDVNAMMGDDGVITQFGGPSFFRTTGTPLLRGRDFTVHDRAGAPAVVIVNQSFARRSWPGRDAIGQCMYLSSPPTHCATVVGVVADAQYVTLEMKRRPVFFVPLAQADPSKPRTLLVRTTGDPRAMVQPVRRALDAMMPGLPYIDATPLTDVLRPELQSRRLGAAMFGVFGLLALVLAAAGVYGVVSYVVERRTHEVGVRMALGARASQVVTLIVGRGVWLTGVGAILGLGGALAGARLVRSQLFGVEASDPVTLLGAAIVLLVVAAVASWVPARRAAHVDPLIALRSE